MSTVLTRLGLELHPEKTRTVDLSRGREGFDFLGCHLRKRMSGPHLGADAATRLLPAAVAVSARDARVRARVRGADRPRAVPRGSPPRHCGRQSRAPRLGRSTFARATRRPISPDRSLRRGPAARPAAQARGSSPARRSGGRWRRPFFEALGLYRLRGTIQYPGVA